MSVRYIHSIPPGNFLDLTPLSPVSYVSESFTQDIGQFHSPQISTWKGFLFIKNILFIMENLTNSRETVETGVDPRLDLG